MCLPDLTVGRRREALYDVVDVVVLQVWVVHDGGVVTGLVPAEALRWVVAVG